MINILSYVGMNMQSEVCLWCLLGLVRTIFDATLFKVNANLKQVWQMNMPAELSMPVQRVLRTMVSGVMLVQCFTVYVYLASYIVLLYPVFLEERPTLVLPWLLLAAIRKLLCELTSLALGLGTCVLLGPARTPCIKFVVVKFSTIMPAFYMWMLVFSYYHALKVATAFKTFPAVLPPNDNDYGLELAVRRRRTKSLLGEDQLRKKLVANFYGESVTNETYLRPQLNISSRMVHSTDTSIDEDVPEPDTKPAAAGWSDNGAYEDWFGSEIIIPRDTDRILEQIVLMLLRVGAYMKKEGSESIIDAQRFSSVVPEMWPRDNIECTINNDDTETPRLVGSSRGNTASYLREYPQIFMKKPATEKAQTEPATALLTTVRSYGESDESKHKTKRNLLSVSHETLSTSDNLETESSIKTGTESDILSTKEVSQSNISGIEKTKEKQQEIEMPLQIKNNETNNSVQVSEVSTENSKKKSLNSNLNINDKSNESSNRDVTDNLASTVDNEKISHLLVNSETGSEKSIAIVAPRETQTREINLKFLEQYKNMVYKKLMSSDNNSRETSDDFIINEFDELINGKSTLAQMLNIEHNEEFVLNSVANELRNRYLFANDSSNESSYEAIFDTSCRDLPLTQIFNLDSQENFKFFRKTSNESSIEKDLSLKIANENECDSNSDSKTLSKDASTSIPQSKDKFRKYATIGLRHDKGSDNEIKKEPPSLMQNEIIKVGKNEDLPQDIKIKDLTQDIKIEEITDKQAAKYNKPKEVPFRIMSVEDNLGPEKMPNDTMTDDNDKEVTPKESKQKISQTNVLTEEDNKILKDVHSKESIDTKKDNNNPNVDGEPNSSENTKRNA